jgi:L-fuculose-phosphate aldolase
MEEAICYYMKKCFNNKWITSYDGNISYKTVNNDLVYITPSSVKKQHLTKEQIILLSIVDSKIIKNNYNLQPSGELDFHMKIHSHYNFNNNTNLCIIHVHPPNILAYVGLLKTNRELDTIKMIFPEINIKIGRNVDYYTAKTPILAEKVYENIIGNDIIALKRHGIVAIGDNFEDVMDNINTLEYYCKIFLKEKEN